MIVTDTSIWVEFFKKNEPIFSSLVTLLENRDVLGIECIFGELLQGARNKREKAILRSYWENLHKTAESGIWIKAGEYSSEKKLLPKGIGLIDAAIIIAAKKTSSKIWTLDKKLLKVLEKEERYFP